MEYAVKEKVVAIDASTKSCVVLPAWSTLERWGGTSVSGKSWFAVLHVNDQQLLVKYDCVVQRTGPNALWVRLKKPIEAGGRRGASNASHRSCNAGFSRSTIGISERQYLGDPMPNALDDFHDYNW